MKFFIGFLALAILLVSTSPASAKKFSKCDLARTLVKHGIARSALPNWICLIQSESSMNTAATHKNNNGSKDWGLFQVNDRYWCKDGRRGGDCNINCRCECHLGQMVYDPVNKFLSRPSALIDNNISDDVSCAKIIHKRHGYNAWYGWQSKCKGKRLPSVNECF